MREQDKGGRYSRPPEPDPELGYFAWLAEWGRIHPVRAVFCLVCLAILIYIPLAYIDAASGKAARGVACFQVQTKGEIESSPLGTDFVRGHVKGHFCDEGAYLNLGGTRTRVEVTTFGELWFWSGRELNKGLYCANGTNSNCRFAVWWGRFKGVQRVPGTSIPANTEYMRVRIRCNYQRECRGADRNWGRAPYPLTEPPESTDVWDRPVHTIVWNTTLPQ